VKIVRRSSRREELMTLQKITRPKWAPSLCEYHRECDSEKDYNQLSKDEEKLFCGWEDSIRINIKKKIK